MLVFPRYSSEGGKNFDKFDTITKNAESSL